MSPFAPLAKITFCRKHYFATSGDLPFQSPLNMEEKPVSAAHMEEARGKSAQPADFDDERAPEARGRDLQEVPRGYWFSPLFLGSFLAIGYGFAAATGGFALIAPILAIINNDVGSSPIITWIALSYLLCQTVFFLDVGRFIDIFGRRWFFIIGSILGLIGSTLEAIARSVNQFIGAEVFIGIASGFQISFFWVVAEVRITVVETTDLVFPPESLDEVLCVRCASCALCTGGQTLLQQSRYNADFLTGL
jgi:hypothetical protein